MVETNKETQAYLPKSLIDSGLPPVFDPYEIIYMKFVKDGKPVRVARLDPTEGLVLALYPTKNPDKFSGEAFYRIEDDSPRRTLKRSDINDEIWLGLLDDLPPAELLKDYKCDMLGVHPSGSYKYKEGNQTFHIIVAEEPSIENKIEESAST